MSRGNGGGETERLVRLRSHASDEGWERRFVATPDRAEEAEQLYREMGFEVRVERLEPDQLEARCGACAEVVCATYVVIYTRKPERSRT